jgi:curved DNA-binding protein CbpA
VPRSATTPQIRAAYVAQARLAHPDLNQGRGGDLMQALNEAWDILKDASRRQAWDATHHVPGTNGTGGSGGGAIFAEDGGRPFWTGAMGPAPGRPHGPVVHFGIYDGWSLGEIARRDRGYLIWLRDRPEAEAMQAEIVRLLDPTADETPEPRRQKRRWSPRG